MKTVVMVSGGIDSFLASSLFPDSKHVYVNYGQKYDPMERSAARKMYPGLIEIDISGLPDTGDDYYVPARNLMLATIGLRFGDEVCFAGVMDEQCPDKNPQAFLDMSKILSQHSKREIRIFSPFWRLTKAEAVREYLLKGHNPNDLLRTVSCYEGTGESCNACEACFRRFICLKVNGLDTTRPAEQIIKEYGMRLLHTFSKKRQLTTISAVNSSRTPVNVVNLADYLNVAKLSKIDKNNGYLVICSSLPENDRASITAMLRSEHIDYDSIVMETAPSFFETMW